MGTLQVSSQTNNVRPIIWFRLLFENYPKITFYIHSSVGTYKLVPKVTMEYNLEVQ